jgi:ketosteroid isomerase-like protein
MSQENVDRIREAVEAFNRGDVEAAFTGAHPEIVWETLDIFPDAGTHRGPDEVRGFFESWQNTFRGFRMDLEECVPIADDQVLAAVRVGGEGAESGVEVETPLFFQLLEFRDDQLFRSRMFRTRAEALEAAGLSE